MQTLKLADDLFAGLLDGTKRCTVRPGKRDIDLGPLTFEATNGTHAPVVVEVVQVSRKRLGDLTDEDAEADGAGSPEELEDALRRLYPDLITTSVITVIYFARE